MYQVEIVWNREFHWTLYGSPYPTKEEAIRFAERMKYLGDGASVKKIRVVDTETDSVVYGG